MANVINESTAEGAKFTRSLEKILRALIKLLIGRISLVRLEELVRMIFVNECEEHLRREFPENRVKLSQLSLLTGMDTRALTKLTNSESFVQPSHQNEKFLIGMTIESQLVDLWTTDPRFADKNGKPATLSLSEEDEGPRFELLLKSIKRSRGLTTQSIIKRLEKAGTVVVNKEMQQIALDSVGYYPFLSRDETETLGVGFRSASLLLDSVIHNINSLESEEDLLYQRDCFSHCIPKTDQQAVRKGLRKILLNSENECRALLVQYEDDHPGPSQIFAGAGLYYFESSQ